MTFKELVEKLMLSSNIKTISAELDDEIVQVQFLDPSLESFKSNVLYFCNNPQLLRKLPPQCIITSELTDIPIEKGSRHNLAAVPGAGFGAVFNTSFSLIDNSQNNNFYEDMMNTLERVKNVDTLIDIASQKFGASLVFIDRDFRILSYSTMVPITDTLWQHNIEQGYCDYGFIQEVMSLKSVQMADSSTRPIEVTCAASPFQKFSCRVYCHDIWIGFLIVIEGYTSYRPEHVEMLHVMSGILGYAVKKYAPQFLYLNSDYHQFLYRLIIGADASEFPDSYHRLQFPSEMLVLYIKPTTDAFAFPKEQQLSDALTMAAPGCHAISQKGAAIVIGSSEILPKVGSILNLIPSRCAARAGVSLPFSNISELKQHYQEAVDAYEVGMMLDPDIKVYTFEEYGIYVMFKSVSDTDKLERYMHPALRKLIEYDSLNSGNLMQTLYSYLQHACNTTDTAAALFLHRNSVIYRLHKIEELCGIDLDDTDTQFRLRLSYAIANVIHGKQKWTAEPPDERRR